MPQIIVTANRGDDTVTWRERINASDFESEHFAQQLVERIGWAVSDAHEVEQDADRRPLSSQGRAGRAGSGGELGQTALTPPAGPLTPLGERRDHGLVHAGSVGL